MELVKGSAHALVYETGLLIGHTHILFYFIFQLLVQKHKISTIKGVSFTCGLVWLNWIILGIFWREVGLSLHPHTGAVRMYYKYFMTAAIWNHSVRKGVS